jgi:hypothetical protein
VQSIAANGAAVPPAAGTPAGANYGMATMTQGGTAVPVQVDTSVVGQSKILFLTPVVVPLGQKLEVILT